MQIEISREDLIKAREFVESGILVDAMNDAEGLSFEGEDGIYGLSVSIVNGVRADYTLDGAYWAFYVDGEYCNYGVSEQPVEDGDNFSIVYTVAQ